MLSGRCRSFTQLSPHQKLRVLENVFQCGLIIMSGLQLAQKGNRVPYVPTSPSIHADYVFFLALGRSFLRVDT